MEFDGLNSDPDRIGYSQLYNGGAFQRRVKILDTTLREGEQSPGISFTTKQRLQIGWMLDYFGVDAIEISPIVSESHFESCKRLISAGLSAQIVAHGRALKEDIDVALSCGASFYAMYHSISDIHLKYKLKVTREQALQRTIEAVEYAKAHGLGVRVTLEDASRADPGFAREFAIAVYRAGADRVSVPDTVGAMRPAGMYRLVSNIRDAVPIPIDVHCHNDLGLALANALAGYEAGADQIHTTIGGIGERTGITDLAQLIFALYFLYGLKLNVRYQMISDLYHLLEEYTSYRVPPSAPLVGSSAYKHKAGTHIAAILNNPHAYELVPPEFTGNRRRVIFGDLVGKNGSLFLMKILGINADESMAKSLAAGVKKLQIADLFELELNQDLIKRITEANRVESNNTS